MEQVALRNLAKFTEKHLCNFIKKETLVQVFSCEFWEIAKNTFFTEHLWWLLYFISLILLLLLSLIS